MIKTLRELNMGTLCMLYVFGFMMLGCQYLFSAQPLTASAQMSGSGGMGGSSGGGSSSGSSGNSGSQYVATVIGGKTGGVNDDETCCNGVVLDFTSVNKANVFILDGYALYVPGISESYDHGNEFSEGYNVLGTVGPEVCLIPSSECYEAEYILGIRVIGTSENQS